MKSVQIDKHINKPKEEEYPCSDRNMRRKQKKKIDNLFKYVSKIDYYWVRTLSFSDKYDIYINWSLRDDYKTLISFVDDCKEEGYGDLIKARNIKINDILKT